MPMISSLLTLLVRQRVSPLGPLLSLAASIRSLRPSRSPEDCGPAQALAARERHQVETHLGEPPEVLHRRDVRGGVDQGRDVVLPGDRDELLVMDLALGVGEIQEEHHGRLVADRGFSISSRVTTSIIFTPALRIAWS